MLADIFLGKITKWNDPALAKLNPGVQLPGTDITVVHRSDGSGTTYIWVDFLAKVSPEWKQKVGVATSVNWPTGVGGKGNEGVAGLVRQTPGSIGYVELIYALQNKIEYGSVQNAAGEFVAGQRSERDRGGRRRGRRACRRISGCRSPTRRARACIPIASFTWLLLYENPKDKQQARIFVDFMKWALADGQKFAADLGYAPLPEAVVKMELEALGEDQAVSARSMPSSPSAGSGSAPGSSRLAVVAARGGHRRRADAPVVAGHREVRAEVLADRRLGSGRPASSAHGRSSGARSIRPCSRCCSRRRCRSGSRSS